MKYEICKRNKRDKNIWSAVAWANTWEWAKEIVGCLNCLNDEEFAVLKDGKIIKILEEAMKE